MGMEKRRKIWKTTPFCLFWITWKQRNHIPFENENEKLNIQKWKTTSVFNMWSWPWELDGEGQNFCKICQLVG